jgi:phage terminase large subunit
MSSTLAIPKGATLLDLPRKLEPLLEPAPYKVLWGGRNGLKSWNIGRLLLAEGVKETHRVLCGREVQNSLADSVHQLLRDQIELLNYSAFYEVTDKAIRGKRTDTLFRFTGLSDQTAESIKSFEGFDRFWAEEAQAITKRSWQMVLPTIFRTPGAEAWIGFNPNLDSDETWVRFVVNRPEGAVVIEMNWRDALACGWFTAEQEKLRQYDLQYGTKDDYDNIWEGKPRTVVAGAIYAREVMDMITAWRYRPIPYDPRLPVHRIWDLGWADSMSVIMVQKPHPSVLNIVNYLEDSRLTYANVLAAADRLNYRWGDDWLPHDASQHHPTSGTNARKQLMGLGCRVKDIPRSDPEARIRAARMLWPRIYMDNSKHETPTDRPDMLLGAGNLMERLKRYKRTIPRATNEPAGPLHDASSHGADAFGGLAEIAERIRNAGETTLPTIPAYQNPQRGLGMLG